MFSYIIIPIIVCKQIDHHNNDYQNKKKKFNYFGRGFLIINSKKINKKENHLYLLYPQSNIKKIKKENHLYPLYPQRQWQIFKKKNLLLHFFLEAFAFFIFFLFFNVSLGVISLLNDCRVFLIDGVISIESTIYYNGLHKLLKQKKKKKKKKKEKQSCRQFSKWIYCFGHFGGW